MDSPGAGPGTTGNVTYNTLLPKPGCQFYILPTGGSFNLTFENGTMENWITSDFIIYAVNCSLSDSEYRAVWARIAQGSRRGPFRLSLAPLMSVMSICLVGSLVIIGIIVALRRHERPWFHKVVLVAISVLIGVFYGFVHHFSRQEHIGGYESTDSYTNHFFSTARSIVTFLIFSGIMICEMHVVVSIFKSAKSRLWATILCALFFAFENSWWIASVGASGSIYNVETRQINWKIDVWFWLEIGAHIVYCVIFWTSVFTMWRYAFFKRNKALGIFSLIGNVFPLALMLITATVDGCFPWSLPLTMVVRGLSLVFVWDWFVAFTRIKTQLDTEDTLGRLITTTQVKEELNENLGDSHEGYGAIVVNSFAARVVEVVKHPLTLPRKVNVMEVDANESELIELQSVQGTYPDTDFDSGRDQSSKKRRNHSKYKASTSSDVINHHHPTLKHTVKVRGGSKVQNIRQRSYETSRRASSSRAEQQEDSSASVRGSLHSSSVNQTIHTERSMIYSGSRPSETNDIHHQSSSTLPNTSDVPSVPVDPACHTQVEATEEDEEEEAIAPPSFVPNPGFRSGDYHNEKS